MEGGSSCSSPPCASEARRKRRRQKVREGDREGKKRWGRRREKMREADLRMHLHHHLIDQGEGAGGGEVRQYCVLTALDVDLRREIEGDRGK